MLELELELERELTVLDILAADELLLALDLLIAEELLEALLELCADNELEAEDAAELELSPELELPVPTDNEVVVFAVSPPLQAISHEHATISTTILRKFINMTPSQCDQVISTSSDAGSCRPVISLPPNHTIEQIGRP